MRQISKQKREKINLDNIDIRLVLDEIGIEYFESGKNVSNNWIGTACPWCGDKSSHLGLCLTAPVVSCFKCGHTGNYLTYLSEELQSFPKAMDILQEFQPRELKPYQEGEHKKSIKVNLPKNATRIIQPEHAGYLEGRGFDYKKLEKYNLHYCNPLGKWANRIIVPIYKGYKLLTFTSIDISDDVNIKYKHLSEEESVSHVKEILYGSEFTNGVVCSICEGIFDMWRIGDGALCTFGTKVTAAQKKILSKYNKVLICFDGDQAGKEGAEKLANDLAAFVDIEILTLPFGKDPDTLDKEDLRFIRNKIDGKY